jgi:hypothetical protein
MQSWKQAPILFSVSLVYMHILKKEVVYESITRWHWGGG